jgi:hypothetical protein
MAMNQQDRDINEQLQSTLRGQRRRVEELARMLSQQSVEQWQRAVEGIVALPAAVVTSVAASTLFTVGFVTRGFEVFQEASREFERGSDERPRFGRDGQRREREGEHRISGESQQQLGQEKMPRA